MIDTGIVDTPADDRLPSEGWAQDEWVSVGGTSEGGGQPVRWQK